MFDALKNLGQLKELMGKASQMQEQMKRVQEQSAAREMSAEAADGRVRATVNGRMELVALKIDSARMDLSNSTMLEEMILSAVRAAQIEAAAALQADMKKMSDDLGIPPGMLP